MRCSRRSSAASGTTCGATCRTRRRRCSTAASPSADSECFERVVEMVERRLRLGGRDPERVGDAAEELQLVVVDLVVAERGDARELVRVAARRVVEDLGDGLQPGL